MGSSKMTTLASCIRARAISTIWAFAPDSERTAASTLNVASSRPKAAAACRRIAPQSKAPRAGARARPPDEQVLDDGQVGEQRSSSCGTMAMPAASAARGDVSETVLPGDLDVTPRPGTWTPWSIFISVLLPAPFSPITAWTSPGRISRSTPRHAQIPPNLLPAPLTRRHATVDGCHLPVGTCRTALLVDGPATSWLPGDDCPSVAGRWRPIEAGRQTGLSNNLI